MGSACPFNLQIVETSLVEPGEQEYFELIGPVSMIDAKSMFAGTESEIFHIL